MNKILIAIGLLLTLLFLYNNSSCSRKLDKKESREEIIKKLKEEYINPIKFIDQVFTFLSRNSKIVLDKDCIKNEYITPDIPNSVENDIDNTLASIISKTNCLCCSYFVLRRKNLVMTEMNDKGKRYVIDGVLHETVDHFTIRFILDYIMIGDKTYINYISVVNTSVYNLMPPPENSSESVNNHYKTKIPFGTQFKEDWGSRLNNLYNEKYNVIGLDNSSLDFSILQTPDFQNVFDIEDSNKWIIPFDQMDRHSDFCKKESLQWDRFGANLPLSVGDGCLMNNTAYEKRNVLPNVEPEKVGVITEYGDPDNSKNAWLFNAEHGNVIVETAIS